MTSSAHKEPAAVRLLIIVMAALLVAAMLSIQALIGGTRLLFALPADAILAVTGVIALALIGLRKPGPDPLCFWSTLVFFGYILARAAFSPVAYQARLDLYPALAGLAVYFLTSTVLTDTKARMGIILALLAAALAHVVVGAIQFRHGDNFMPFSFLQRFDYGRRASGFYICPNHLAGLLEVLGIFGLSITCWSRLPAWAKLLIGYATVMCYVGVILSASRGGYLSVLASLLVFIFLSIRILRAAGATMRARIGTGAVIFAALAGLATFLLISKSDYLTERTKNVAERGNVRLDFWKAAAQQFTLNPTLGTGSRTYLYYGRKFRSPSVQMDPVYVHNDYLQLLADYGLLGLALFGPFVLAHARRGWINARRLGPKRIVASHRIASNAMALNLGAVATLGAYLVHSFFDFNLHIPANVLVLAFVFGLLANAGVVQEAPSMANRIALFSGRIVLAGVALFLGWQVWRLAPGELAAEQARVALRDNQVFAAINSAQEGLTHEQQNPSLYYYLGRARMLAGDRQANLVARNSFYLAAIPAFAKARALAPLDSTYTVELAFACDALGRYEEAEWLYGEALAFDPRSEAIRHYYEAHLGQWQTGQPAEPPVEDRSPAEPPS